MPADRLVDGRLTAANPIPPGETLDWAASAEGCDTFGDVVRAAAVSDVDPMADRPRRRWVWPRRLALAGVAVVSLAALGVSLAVALDNGNDDAGDFAGPGFVVGDGDLSDPAGAPHLFLPPPAASAVPDAAEVAPGGPAQVPGTEAGGGPAREIDGGAGGGDDDDAPAANVSEPALGRGPDAQIVKAARLEIVVADGGLVRAHADARSAVDVAGGFIESSDRSPRSVTLTARIPADRFEEVLADVEGLGEVRQQSVSGEDVGAELVDIGARLRHWRAQESVLLDLMEQATTVSESIEVRRELAPVQETIERLEGRRRVLADDVEFSTLNLFLVDPDVEALGESEDDDPGWFSEVWSDATGIGRTIVRGTIVALGALVPITALWVAPILGVVWLRRRRFARPRLRG